jgi:hypothetical protein
MSHAMSQPLSICTIVAKNYIAAARTLCQSFLANHPNGKCYVLIIDDLEDFIDPTAECFEIILLEALSIAHLSSFCFKYDVVELATASKPYFMEYLITERCIDRLLYIDPDILITNPLNSLFERLKTYDIVLTPHTLVDYPDDGLEPDLRSLLTTGMFNLGFIGVNASKNARHFLNWWKRKVYNNCVVDSESGLFVDQKFCDLIPSFFDNYYVEKDAGYNVANWNLHERTIVKENGIWRCNGGALFFFHFSNYRPETPGILSKWSTRSSMKCDGDLARLMETYRQELLANEYHPSRSWPYTYSAFDTGERIPNELRAIYRKSPDKWQVYGDPFSSGKLKRMARRVNRKRRIRNILMLWKGKNFKLALKRLHMATNIG